MLKYLFAFFILCVACCMSANAQIDITVGTGFNNPGCSNYPTPFQDYYEGARMQFLYRASELNAAGMAKGLISAISYKVESSCGSTIENFTIKMGTTTAADLNTGTWEPGTVQVYDPTDFTPVPGVNKIILTTPFEWNGVDNLVLEICNGDPNNATQNTATSNFAVNVDFLNFVCTHTYVANDSGNLCNTTNTTQKGGTTVRPNIVFSWQSTDSCLPLALPYFQGFEVAPYPALPACIINQSIGTSAAWGVSQYPSPDFGSKVAYVDLPTSQGDAWLYLQGLQLQASISYRLSFRYFVYDSTRKDRLKVYYGSAPVADSMNTILLDSPSRANYDVYLSTTDFTVPAAGVYYFGFDAHAPLGYNYGGVVIDSITVAPTPTCYPPTAIGHSNITTSGVQLSFVPPVPGSSPQAYQVYYSTLPTLPTSSTIPIDTLLGSTSVTQTGLLPNKKYFVWLRADCGGGDHSVWSAADSFSTPCIAVNIPYSENFDNASPPAVPSCTSVETFSINPWTTSPTSGLGFTGKSLVYNPPGTPPVDTGNTWFYTRGLNLNGGISYRLMFKYGTPFANCIESMNVKYGSSPTVVNMTDSLFNKPVISTHSIPQTAVIDFVPTASGVYYIGFHEYSRPYQTALIIDDISVILTPAMPVTLLDFTGKKQDNTNLLTWRTAIEQNNRGFELQKSANGIDFSSIAFVPTKAATGGNSTATLNYNYTDVKPFAAGSYYRLKQVDLDGKSTLSNVVFLKGEGVTQLLIASIYPNPTRQLLNVSLQSPQEQKVVLIITDLAGKTVQQQNLQLQKGDNNKVMKVALLAKGTYVVKLVCADGCEAAVSKFVKE